MHILNNKDVILSNCHAICCESNKPIMMLRSDEKAKFEGERNERNYLSVNFKDPSVKGS